MGQVQSSNSYNCSNGGVDGATTSKALDNLNQSKFSVERTESAPRKSSSSNNTARRSLASNNKLFNASRRSGNQIQGKNGTNSSEKASMDQQHVRKLSNVSNRNIQLLSMKPRSDRDAYADGLRSRRRSSLINLILGAPSSGPRFSDDLCSLSSHMSELCNFGIDYFPDPVAHYTTKTTSINSSLTRLEEGDSNCLKWGLANEQLINVNTTAATTNAVADNEAERRQSKQVSDGNQHNQHKHYYHRRRRRSSFGSMTSFELSTATANSTPTIITDVTNKLGLTTRQQDAISDATKSNNPFMGISYDPKNATKTTNATDGEPNDDDDGDNKTTRDFRLRADDKTKKLESKQRQTSPCQLDRDHDYHVDDQGLSERREFYRRRPSLSSIFLASIDLTSSMDEDGCSGANKQEAHLRSFGGRAPSLVRTGQMLQYGASSDSGCPPESKKSTTANTFANTGAAVAIKAAAAADNDTGVTGVPSKRRINQAATANTRPMFHHSGSELSLYSSASASSGNLSHHQLFHNHHSRPGQHQHGRHRPHQSHQQASRSHQLSCGTGIGTNVLTSCYGSVDDDDGGARKKLPSHLISNSEQQATALVRETKLIIMLQVCLPFILAGFGNMAAGLVLNKVAQREAFRNVPIFFVLLPSFVGLKGNIEMTLASRLSTLANLNLLDTSHQRRHAYVSNLILILSQAIGLSIFAAISSMLCEFSMGKLDLDFSDTLKVSVLVVLPCALLTSIVLVFMSSIIMGFAIWLANQIQVNPDNLSTLIAAMYGDVSCVLTYGIFAELMYTFNQRNIFVWPIMINCLAIISWPILWYGAYKFKETHDLSMTSMPPMLTGIAVSLGSGTILSLVVGRFSRIALYQPVVNGFGANLIAVQASRVSTWLWCTALRRLSDAPHPSAITKDKLKFEHSNTCRSSKLGASLASFTDTLPDKDQGVIGDAKESKSIGKLLKSSLSILHHIPKSALKSTKTLLWSFFNSSPNSVAARLLLIMLVPAHTLYFFVIWLLSPANYIVITWQFYAVYIALCLTQVFILLTICEPLMTFLMQRHLDPDIFGISLLMALADLVGTLCLTGAFIFLASIGDPNAF